MIRRLSRRFVLWLNESRKFNSVGDKATVDAAVDMYHLSCALVCLYFKFRDIGAVDDIYQRGLCMLLVLLTEWACESLVERRASDEVQQLTLFSYMYRNNL